MEILENIIDGLGVVLGLAFIYFTVKPRKSLIGSFFKKFYGRMTIGSIFFTLGFVTDLNIYFGFNESIVEIIHHISLLVAALIFVIISVSLPKEISEYMERKGGNSETL